MFWIFCVSELSVHHFPIITSDNQEFTLVTCQSHFAVYTFGLYLSGNRRFKFHSTLGCGGHVFSLGTSVYFEVMSDFMW
jgi:hypothetical protein